MTTLGSGLEVPASSAQTQIAELVGLDTLKTWSLIATLFGDLDGEELSGAQIRRLLSHIGLKPEAIRVALHRLRSDGWIVSTKQGREAVYRMSPTARAETRTVAPSIYRDPAEPAEPWQFELFRDAPTNPRAILLNRNLGLVPGGAGNSDPETLALRLDGATLPAWVESSLVSDHLRDIAQRLSALAAGYTGQAREIDALTTRLLVLHHWRRIALRPGSWAHASLLPQGAIARCHVAVFDFLARTERMTEAF
ncbi:MAG: hypothetical protein AAFN09_15900 [Pseudomonadota bacterium]